MLTSAPSQAGQWLEYLGNGGGTSWWPAGTADSGAANRASHAGVGNKQKFGKQQKRDKAFSDLPFDSPNVPYRVCFDWIFFSVVIVVTLELALLHIDMLSSAIPTFTAS